MTSKSICPTHEVAFASGESCPYCVEAPKAEAHPSQLRCPRCSVDGEVGTHDGEWCWCCACGWTGTTATVRGAESECDKAMREFRERLNAAPAEPCKHGEMFSCMRCWNEAMAAWVPKSDDTKILFFGVDRPDAPQTPAGKFERVRAKWCQLLEWHHCGLLQFTDEMRSEMLRELDMPDISDME